MNVMASCAPDLCITADHRFVKGTVWIDGESPTQMRCFNLLAGCIGPMAGLTKLLGTFLGRDQFPDATFICSFVYWVAVDAGSFGNKFKFRCPVAYGWVMF